MGTTDRQVNQAGAQSQEMRAITVSRLYGSGGGEVAARLARRLGWHLVDHEVVVRVARALGITQEEAEARDEQVQGLVERLISSMAMAYPSMNLETPPIPTVQSSTYQEALRRVIVAALDEGHVVIVGRAGQSILADRRDVLRVLVVAPLEARVRYVAQREGLDDTAARRRIEEKDRDRARYLHERFGHHATDPLLYDLVVNTGVLTLDDTVDLICQALERKGARLGASLDQLGPGAGLGGYPGRPEDVPSPTDVG